MGTKLGNLHIRNATVEEVAPLLPGAIVGQWAEGFVSAYSEEYQWGSVEQAGKKLSRKLPAATILTAALFDSDVVSFEVYEAGKRLTTHLLNPYEDINQAGNPKVFCEALGLPPEDEKRLRTLWKKGNAEEQLELTGTLLGLPLYHDPAYMPQEPARRDTETVDAWIAQRPDPPKIKSVTRAELVQEITEVGLEASNTGRKCFGGRCGFVFAPALEDGVLEDAASNRLWVPLSDGTLHCVRKANAEHPLGPDPDDWLEVEKTLRPYEHSIAMFQDRLYTRSEECSPDPKQCASFHFFCYDRKGNLCGDQALPWNTELIATDREGGLWLGENLGRTIVHLDRNLNLLSRSSSLTSEHDYHVLDMDLSKDGETVFLTSFQKGLFLLSTKDLSILRVKLTKDTVYDATIDGKGRFWAGVSDSVLEAYDRNLQTISRHRLKGAIVNLHRNAQGDLIAYTHDYKRNIFRVYRMS